MLRISTGHARLVFVPEFYPERNGGIWKTLPAGGSPSSTSRQRVPDVFRLFPVRDELHKRVAVFN